MKSADKIAINSIGVDDAEQQAFEALETGLLYLIGGYDSNAAVVARSLELPEGLPSGQRFAFRAVESLLLMSEPPRKCEADVSADAPLRERVRDGLWREIGSCIAEHIRWLRDPDRKENDAAQRLGELSDRLSLRGHPMFGADHQDVNHFALLTRAALVKTEQRALRNLESPEESNKEGTMSLKEIEGNGDLMDTDCKKALEGRTINAGVMKGIHELRQ